jgi:CMP-N-acetylneuraminic acid synthetase
MFSLVCIIPIRSKSKSIKNKNIKKLCGIPLVIYAINAAICSKIFKKIIIATDSNFYIRYISKELKCRNIFFKDLVFFKRSAKSTNDFSPTEIVIKEVLKKINKYNICYIIQATSPLLNFSDIKKSFYQFKKKKLDSMFSAYKFKKFIWANNKKPESINYNYLKRPMRQRVEYNFVENGAFYAFDIKKFFSFNNRLFGKIGIFEMPPDRSIDIDEKKDFKRAELYLKNKKS